MVKDVLKVMKENGEIKVETGERIFLISSMKLPIYAIVNNDLLFIKNVKFNRGEKFEVVNVTPQEIEAKILNGEYKNYRIIIDKNELEYNFHIR